MSSREDERPRSVGEIFDRAVDAVIRNAVFVVGTAALFECAIETVEALSGTTSLIGSAIDAALQLLEFTFLTLAIDGYLSRRPFDLGETFRSALRGVPRAFGASLALLFILGFGFLLGTIVVTILTPLVRGAPLLVSVAVGAIPVLGLLALAAYLVAVAGLTLAAIVLDTRSPFDAIRIAFAWLGGRIALHAMFVAGAAFCVYSAAFFFATYLAELLSGSFPMSAAYAAGIRVVFLTIFTAAPAAFNIAALVALRRDVIVRREGADLLQEGSYERAKFLPTISND